MLLGILKQLNWLDFFVIIIFLRIAFIAFNSGFPLELFKLLGTVFSVYLSLHYFTFFTDYIGQRNPSAKERVPLEFMNFISLIAIAIIGYLIFVALRLVFDRFVKMEISSVINRWLALLLGAIRGFFLASLITFVLVISSIGYLKNSVKVSFIGKQIFNFAPNAYSWMWNNIASKFAIGENFNHTVLEVQKDLNS